MKYILLFSVITWMLYSCNKDNPTPPQQAPADFFFPMKVGNFWVYKVTTQNGPHPNYTIDISFDTLRITDDTVIGSVTYYQFRSLSRQGLANDWWLGDSSGTILFSNGDRFPLSDIADDTISSYLTDNGFDHRVYKSGVLDTLITVPAGTYHCLESVLDFYYLTTSPPLPNSNPRQTLSYFCKNIGLVKTKNWYSSESGDVISELESYFIQP